MNSEPTPAGDSPFRSESEARDSAPQFVLPLVVRIERAAPPARPPPPGTCAGGGRGVQRRQRTPRP
ncbi:hypothetical protein ACFXDP_12455, partial [Streptomyces sp. NPDC059374]